MSVPNDPNGFCPECGAPRQDGLSCWEQLGMLLAWEWQDPALLAQHFLTVASYNLQHPAQFQDVTLQGLRADYIAHLDDGLPVTEIRKNAGRFAQGATRVLRPEAARAPTLRRWRRTIANVYLPDQPQNAAQRVKEWAAAIRAEL